MESKGQVGQRRLRIQKLLNEVKEEFRLIARDKLRENIDTPFKDIYNNDNLRKIGLWKDDYIPQYLEETGVRERRLLEYMNLLIRRGKITVHKGILVLTEKYAKEVFNEVKERLSKKTKE